MAEKKNVLIINFNNKPPKILVFRWFIRLHIVYGDGFVFIKCVPTSNH